MIIAQCSLGRYLRRCLVQLSAHTSIKSEVRPSCSGLYPVRVWKPPMTETAQSLWTTNVTDRLLSVRGKSSSLHPVWNSHVSVCSYCLLPSHPTLVWRAQLHLLEDLLLLCHPHSYLCSWLNKLSSSSQGRHSRPSSILITFHWNCFNLLMFFLK